jgi:uncharacterized protein
MPNRAVELPLSHIRLTGGPLLRRQELHRILLRHYDVDRLLHNFRVSAGIQTSASPMEGWESPGCGLRGHFTGHYLSATACMFASTGDTVLRDRCEALVSGLAQCQDALGDGYLGAFPQSEFENLELLRFDKIWAPYYTLHKLLTGLLDAHAHAGSKLALSVVVKLADHFARRLAVLPAETIERMTRTDERPNPTHEFGGIAEAFLSVHALTGEKRHLDAARCFIRDWFLNPLASRENRLRGLHANTHVPQAISFARAAATLDDPRMLEAAIFFFDEVTRRHSFVFGGNAFDEKFGPPGVEAKALSDLTGETCNTHNMLRLARELFSRTQEPRFLDFHEHALLNHIAASICPQQGHTTYHVAAQPGRFKVYGHHDRSLWCCTGTGIENTARYAEGAIFTRGDEVWVQLYQPLSASLPDLGLQLEISTDYPASGTIRIRVIPKHPVRARLHLRIPSWVDSAIRLVAIEGVESLPTEGPRAGFISIDRSWEAPCTFELILPITPRARPAIDDPELVSFFHGPVLLAGELGRDAMPESDVCDSQYAFHDLPASRVPLLESLSPSSLEPDPKAPMRYRVRTAEGGSVGLAPFYETHHQRYALYWRAY